MPQKKLDASDETVRLTLRLPKRLTDDIDRMRGKATRSEYIRTMIEATVGLIAPIELKFETKPMPKIKGIKIMPDEPHRHRFSKEGIQIGTKMVGRIQKPVYSYPCMDQRCVETKVE
jgi:metal-responsive CopG/Arc/MetJ family transcriptional regulator